MIKLSFVKRKFLIFCAKCHIVYHKIFLFIHRHKILTLLERYFLKEFFKTHFIALLIVYLILLINNFILMMPLLLPLQIRLFDILGLILGITPSTIAWALPFSVLLGTLLFIGRLSHDNEITAAACLGVTISHILKPFIVYGICIGIGSYVLDVIISPETNKLYNKITARIASAAPQIIIGAETSILLGDTLLLTGPLSNEGHLQGISIIEKKSEKGIKVTHAKQGLLFRIKNHHESILSLRKMQGIIAEADVFNRDYHLISAEEALYRFSIKPEKLGVSTTFSSKTLLISLKNFIKSKKEFIEAEKNKIIQAKKWQNDLGDLYLEAYTYPHISNKELINTLKSYKENLTPHEFRINFAINAIEFYQKISLVISSLIFIFFSFALAISRNKIYQTTILAIGGFLCVLYWFSYHLTITLIMSYHFTSWLITSSDLAFLITSFFLMRKVRL